MTAAATNELVGAQLKLLTLRACGLADLVTAGAMHFLDAVDVCYDAACASGLVAAIGDDQVQKLLAAAFAEIGREPAP